MEGERSWKVRGELEGERKGEKGERSWRAKLEGERIWKEREFGRREREVGGRVRLEGISLST